MSEPIQSLEPPKDTVFTLIVPLDRKGATATFYLKELTEDIYLASRAFMDKGKDFDAIRMLINDLCIGGSHQPTVLAGNFVASQSARRLVGELLEPVAGELKKN